MTLIFHLSATAGLETYFRFLPAKSSMSDCAFVTAITSIFFALLPTAFATLNCRRYLTEQFCLSWGWITARFFLCRVAEGMLLTNSLMNLLNILNTLVSLQSPKRSLFSILSGLSVSRMLRWIYDSCQKGKGQKYWQTDRTYLSSN